MNLLLDTGRIYGLGYEANSSDTIKSLVIEWISVWASHQNASTQFKGLTWFTDTDHSRLVKTLNTKLNRPKLPGGLSILFYRGAENNSEVQFGQSFIDSLSHVCALDTNLIIVERPERWLSDLSHLNFLANPLDEILKIRRWCLARKATVLFLTPLGNESHTPYWKNLLDGFGVLHTATPRIDYHYWFYQHTPVKSPALLTHESDISIAIESSADVSNAVTKVLSKKSSHIEIKLPTSTGHTDRLLWIHIGAKRVVNDISLGPQQAPSKRHRKTTELTEKQFTKIIELVCPELIGSHPANHWVQINRISDSLLSVFNVHMVIARLPLLDHISAKTVQESYITKPYGSTLTIVSDAAYIAFLTPNPKNENQIQTMLEAKFNSPMYELFSGEMYSRADDIDLTFARVWEDHLVAKKRRAPQQSLPSGRNIVETAISHNISNWNEALQYWYRRWRKHAVKSQPAFLLLRKEK